MKHLSPWWKKKGATAVKRKWCHGNISVPIAHGDTGAKEVGVSVSCKDGGVLPDSGFPRDGGMANEERAKTSLGHGANTSISYNTHAFVHGRRLGVIPSKRAFSGRIESVRCRGSSCTRRRY